MIKIGVFGSFVRGEETSESDIDILVDFKEGYKTFDNYMELKFYLEEILSCKVDLVIESALKPRIKSHILQEIKYA